MLMKIIDHQNLAEISYSIIKELNIHQANSKSINRFLQTLSTFGTSDIDPIQYATIFFAFRAGAGCKATKEKSAHIPGALLSVVIAAIDRGRSRKSVRRRNA
jgi:hypothetical protein